MGSFQVTEGFDAKTSSQITGSLAVSTNITAGNSLTVGNDATIVDELYLPGIEEAATSNALVYHTTTDAVSYTARTGIVPFTATNKQVYRINVTGNSGTNGVIINTTSTPSIYQLNKKNIITTNVNNDDNYIRLSFYEYDPAIYGDFSCTILHKGDATQTGTASQPGDLKLQIYLPNVASVPAGTTYAVWMVGSDNGGGNYEVDQYATYSKGQLIQFFDEAKWNNNQGRRLEDSGLFHIFCSFSTNSIMVHGTNWDSTFD